MDLMSGETKQKNFEKGRKGEEQVAQLYRDKDFTVIDVAGVAKWTKDGNKFFSADFLVFKIGVCHWIQVKNKPPRIIKDDTGFEKWRYDNYKWLQQESGLRIMLIFRDRQNNLVGNWLDELKIYGDHGNTYNEKDKCEMVYFWLKDLIALK